MPCGVSVQRAVELLGRADQIEMHGRHRQLQRRRQIVAQVAEVGRQANPNLVRRRAQPRAGRLQRAQRLARGKIERQHRLVDLHPVGPGVGQPPEHFFVDRQQLVEQRQRLRLRPLALAQQQEASAGPSSTGRVWMPSAAASRNWSIGLVEASLNFMPGSNSGTR